MEENTQEDGKMENSMEKEYLQQQMDKKNMESGTMVLEKDG